MRFRTPIKGRCRSNRKPGRAPVFFRQNVRLRSFVMLGWPRRSSLASLHESRRRCIRRRSCFVGRPCRDCSGSGANLRSSASVARLVALSIVSRYSCWATAAGPRSADRASRINERGSPPTGRDISSPGMTDVARLALTPFTVTRPASICALARLLVLKNRAAHSHLSRRIRASWGILYSFTGRF